MSVSSGCQLQVSLRGAQDILLMSPREDTFFRVEYRRHSNFASGENEQACNTTPALGRRNIQTTISRSGDLLSQIYINARFNPFTATAAATHNASNCVGWVNGLGYAMIDDIVCLVGNKDFDRQDGEFMFQREQVAHKPDRKLGRSTHTFTDVTTGDGIYTAIQESYHPIELNVPLQFWFCNFIEQSLPVIGLYWHEVQLNLSLKSLSDLTCTIGTPDANITSGSLESLQYICNFQYLDRPERAAFANNKLEQVFVQHQTLGEESWAAADNYKEINIRFNHPVTDLMWSPRLTLKTSTAKKEWFNYNGLSYYPIYLANGLNRPSETFRSAQIFFNNQQRTLDLSAEYLRQIPQHRAQEAISPDEFFRVYGYCFGVKVNDILHTGSANFSRYDNAIIRFTLWGSGTQSWAVATEAGTTPITLGSAATVKIHARNFQLNKTSIGMMGVKFAA